MATIGIMIGTSALQSNSAFNVPALRLAPSRELLTPEISPLHRNHDEQ